MIGTKNLMSRKLQFHGRLVKGVGHPAMSYEGGRSRVHRPGHYYSKLVRVSHPTIGPFFLNSEFIYNNYYPRGETASSLYEVASQPARHVEHYYSYII